MDITFTAKTRAECQDYLYVLYDNTELTLMDFARKYKTEDFSLDEKLKESTIVGISIFPSDGDNGDILIQCADIAMYRAKHNGRNQNSGLRDSTVDKRSAKSLETWKTNHLEGLLDTEIKKRFPAKDEKEIEMEGNAV